MENVSRRVMIIGFAFVLTALAYRGLVIGSNGLGYTPASSKKINVLVLNLSDLPSTTSIAIEENIGRQDVAPYLKSRGYNVENVFSFARLMKESNGLHRALIHAFENERDRDSARILTVTLHVAPGEIPNTASTAFALLDTQVSGLIRARDLGVPATSKHIWGYEAPPDEAVIEASFQRFKSKLEGALNQYDQQFLQKLESHTYPPVQSL